MLDEPSPVAAYDSALVTQSRDRPAPAARLVDWKPWGRDNPSLLGHATIAFNSGWIIGHIPIFRGRDGSLSAGGPSLPLLDRDGRQRTDGTGKRQFTPVITFEGAGRDLWSLTIIGALFAAGINPDRPSQPSLPLED